MDRDWLRHTLEVNTVGPMMLVAALTPLLESPAKKGDAGARPPSVVVNFSARVGSIGDNGMGGWHSYRMSKVWGVGVGACFVFVHRGAGAGALRCSFFIAGCVRELFRRLLLFCNIFFSVSSVVTNELVSR